MEFREKLRNYKSWTDHGLSNKKDKEFSNAITIKKQEFWWK